MRLWQSVLIVSTLLSCWLGMQAVHELGHVLGAKLTGGRVVQVVLNPLTISRTDVAENPDPLLVVWAGPLCGVLLPIVAWVSVAYLRSPVAFLFRFFAGFCLLANGLYISIGSYDRVGDSGEMLTQGSPLWILWAFGLTTAPIGFWLWHRQGPQFGWCVPNGEVSRPATVASVVICLTLVVLGFAVGGH